MSVTGVNLQVNYKKYFVLELELHIDNAGLLLVVEFFFFNCYLSRRCEYFFLHWLSFLSPLLCSSVRGVQDY